MSVGKIYIVRHGNTFDKGDVILRVGGKTDLPLSKSGREQAQLLGTKFRDIEFAAAYVSNLRRTKQTARAILGSDDFSLLEFLKEINYGPDEGREEKDVIKRIGQSALDRWDTHSIPPTGWCVDAEDLRTAWQSFLATCADNTNILVVTSNGVARFLLDVVIGGEAAPKKLRTGSYGVISLDAKGSKLVSWNIRPDLQSNLT